MIPESLFHKSRVVLCRDVWPSKSGGYSYLEYHPREFQHVNRPPAPPNLVCGTIWSTAPWAATRLMEQTLRYRMAWHPNLLELGGSNEPEVSPTMGLIYKPPPARRHRSRVYSNCSVLSTTSAGTSRPPLAPGSCLEVASAARHPPWSHHPYHSLPPRGIPHKSYHLPLSLPRTSSEGHHGWAWFFGFKLHLIVNEHGELIAACLTPGNSDDRRPVPDPKSPVLLSRALFGKLFGDKGHISKALFEKLFERGVELITGVRRNMKGELDLLVGSVIVTEAVSELRRSTIS